jgi:ABC-type transport system involved in cytochrome c biogenesis permease subunit
MARPWVLNTRTFLALLVLALVLPGFAQAGRSDELDWSAWQRMPVFHDGRMMPLNTFARVAVEEICGRARPRLRLPDASSVGGVSSEAADARVLFPEGESRRFSAAELLFSWLVEPERWEDVPFLIASHEQLRREVLGLPTTDDAGRRLKHVSPRQLREATRFRVRLAMIGERKRKADREDRKFKLTQLEKKVSELSEAYGLYRLLTFNPSTPAGPRRRFLEKLGETAHTWRRAIRLWRELEPALERLRQVPGDASPGATLMAIQEPMGQLAPLAEDEELALEEIESQVVAIRRRADEAAIGCAECKQRVFSTAPPAGWGESEYDRVQAGVRELADVTAVLAREAHDAHLALYDNGYSLRVVPGLNPAALESQRDPEDDAQPWVNLQTLLVGSDDVLAGFPEREVQAVREAFGNVADAYLDRQDPQRSERFAAAVDAFAGAVRRLGEAMEPVRRSLPVNDRDEDLLALTAYPPPDATWAEVHYYRLDPFFWSWLVGFVAMACLGLAFGLLRKPMFWLGIVTLAASQLFAIYGLGLRVYITGWAPVTNMYETIVFVALVGGLLGLWLTLYPTFGPGLQNAWRMTAIPGTFEAVELSDEQTALARRSRWDAVGWTMLLPRLALAAAVFALLTLMPYGSGSATVIRLLPRVDVGASMPTANDLTVWVVGMCVLALAVLYVPRTLLALAVSVVVVPYTLARRGPAQALEQTYARKSFALAGALLSLVFALLGYYAPVSGKNIGLLMPVLRDNFWLTIHVLTITASYSAALLAWLLGNISLGYYLLGRYREPGDVSAPVAAPAAAKGNGSAAGLRASQRASARRPPEPCATLATFIYKSIQVAFLLLAAGTITGALWADNAWGRFWGWDSKEVWALISLFVYAVVLHGRYARWAGNFGLAAGSVVGATSILMAWYGVNYLLGSGLHTYAQGSGGLVPAVALVAMNWIFMGFAAFRYVLETQTPVVLSPQEADTSR